MERLKQLLGILWLLLSPGSIGLLLWRASVEIGKAPTTENWIFWVIIITIFLPIALGLGIFGYYCWKGYYAHLPTSSAEIEED